ncbi:hypothetical protein [Parapedobacter sp.]
MIIQQVFQDKSLKAKARVSAIAPLFPNELDRSIANLLPNTENPGTVVRWATAYALGEILKLKTDANNGLLPVLEILSAKEEDNGVKKKYLDALKKAKR